MFDVNIENLNIDQTTIEHIKNLLPYLGWLLLAVLIVLVIFFIDKIEKLLALLYKFFSKIFKTVPWIKKRYIKYDFQSSVGGFVNNFLSSQIKSFKKINVQVDWIDEDSIPKSFLEDGRLIVRMRKYDSKNKNFVNAVMAFVSESILVKAKKYISKKQRESIDLYVAKKMFDTKKEEIAVEFVQDYLQPKTEDEKIDEFFAKYENMDEVGLFFPVFVQEMMFLGDKVFNNRKDDSIIKEVTNLINFLDRRSKRVVGKDMDGRFVGEYSKFAILLVGRVDRIYTEGAVPYKRCIKKFVESDMETLYLVGDVRNKEFIKDFVCKDSFLQSIDFSIFNSKKYSCKICDESKCWKVSNYLLVIRRNKIKYYFKH